MTGDLMGDRTGMRRRARWAGVTTAVALFLTACSSVPGGDSPEESPSSGPASPTSSEPGPSESAELYTQKRLSDDIEGDDDAANAAVRDFATAISTGDREAVDEALHAPTPEDPSIIDQTLRTFEDVTWDEPSIRWTENGVLGPCYLLKGEGDEGPVHLAGTAAWNDAEGEWEFTTDGFPGSAEYPDLPPC